MISWLIKQGRRDDVTVILESIWAPRSCFSRGRETTCVALSNEAGSLLLLA